MLEAPDTIAELAQRYQIEDEAEAGRVARAHKLDAMRRAGFKLDPTLAFFEQYAPRAA